MKITGVQFDAPKTRESALNLAAYMSQQVEIFSQKGENLMTNKSDAEKKILKLQEHIADLDKKISTVNTNEKNWQEKLEALQTEHSLTEAEILETKSSLLRKQITSLKKQAGVTDTGNDTLV